MGVFEILLCLGLLGAWMLSQIKGEAPKNDKPSQEDSSPPIPEEIQEALRRRIEERGGEPPPILQKTKVAKRKVAKRTEILEPIQTPSDIFSELKAAESMAQATRPPLSLLRGSRAECSKKHNSGSHWARRFNHLPSAKQAFIYHELISSPLALRAGSQ